MHCQIAAKKTLLFLLPVFLFGFISSMGCPKTGENSNNTQAKNNNDSVAAEQACKECHEEQVKFWAYGGHAEVSCGKCHGVEGNHVEAGTKPLVRGNDQCIECHEKIKDFEHHLLELEKKHVIKVNREKVKNRCVYCHDPHLG